MGTPVPAESLHRQNEGSPALCLSRPCLGQLRALLRRVQRRSCWTSGQVDLPRVDRRADRDPDLPSSPRLLMLLPVRRVSPNGGATWPTVSSPLSSELATPASSLDSARSRAALATGPATTARTS